MKLIIDIDERAYKGSLELKSNDDMGLLGCHLINATANGIPLEDIKAEIQGNYPLYLYLKPYEQAINDVLQILDKHIKENKQ